MSLSQRVSSRASQRLNDLPMFYRTISFWKLITEISNNKNKFFYWGYWIPRVLCSDNYKRKLAFQAIYITSKVQTDLFRPLSAALFLLSNHLKVFDEKPAKE